MPRDSRHYLRVRVPGNHRVACEGPDGARIGEIAVIGLGGLCIRTPDIHPEGTVLSVRFTDEGETVEAMCAVRNHDAEGMGVEFIELRGKNEQNLKKIMTRLAG